MDKHLLKILLEGLKVISELLNVEKRKD